MILVLSPLGAQILGSFLTSGLFCAIHSTPSHFCRGDGLGLSRLHFVKDVFHYLRGVFGARRRGNILQAH